MRGSVDGCVRVSLCVYVSVYQCVYVCENVCVLVCCVCVTKYMCKCT